MSIEHRIVGKETYIRPTFITSVQKLVPSPSQQAAFRLFALVTLLIFTDSIDVSTIRARDII